MVGSTTRRGRLEQRTVDQNIRSAARGGCLIIKSHGGSNVDIHKKSF